MDEGQREIEEQEVSQDNENESAHNTPEIIDSSVEDEGFAGKDDSQSVKKRLGMQAKKHQREMRQMHEKIMHLESQITGSRDEPHGSEYPFNPYPSPGQPNPPGMTEEEKIAKAVRFALGAKEHEERQAQIAQRQAHVHKQYQRLNDEFDRASDKYEDFDDIVRESNAPFSEHVRDALLLVPNPADVAYKLGKNHAELERISKLHPLDQAREVNKVAFSLLSGQNNKSNTPAKANPLDSIRQNPAHSSTAITDKTPASVIRARMKAGTFK